MLRTFSSLAFAAVMLAAAPAYSQSIPTLNVDPTCDIPAEMAGASHDKSLCLKSENEARDKLKQEWSSFSAADRSLCTRTATMGGTASYVELLTCLELQRDARNLPRDQLTRLKK